MSKKKGNFLEQHVDKIVLAVVGILCIVLLWIFVLKRPYTLEFDGSKLGPGKIDDEIKLRAEKLQEKLDESPEIRLYKLDKNAKFAEKLRTAVENIREDVYFPLPGNEGKVEDGDKVYIVPAIPPVADVKIEAIRTVAHIPTQEMLPNDSYAMVQTKLGDIEIITVQALFDVATLYNNFKECFAGKKVKKEWQDKTLAKPVFAKVELSRQRQLEDGTWSPWKAVDRLKIDDFKALLDIPENTQDLDYGVNLKMVQLDHFDVQSSIIQPQPYDFAASNEEWFTPDLHRKFLKLLKTQKSKERTAERDRREAERNVGRRGAMMGPGGGMMGPSGGGGGRGGRGTRQRGANMRSRSPRGGRSNRTGRAQNQRTGKTDKRDKKQTDKDLTFKDLRDKLEKITITEKTNLARSKDPLAFWAHDDSVQPGNTYQYRVRLGVFNPIGGRNYFRNKDEQFKDKVILWSEYSDITDTVTIPERMHIFPLDVDPVDRSVKIQVAKYHIGKWRGEEFTVFPGDPIGHIVESEEEDEEDKKKGRKKATFGQQKKNDQTRIVDYSTGFVVVDVVAVNDWDGVNILRQRQYADLLYSEDETNIMHLAVKSRNWPKHLQTQFKIAKASMNEDINIDYDRTGIQGGMMGPGMMGPGMMGPGMMGPGMMMGPGTGR